MNRFASAAIWVWLLPGFALSEPLVTGTVTARNSTPLAEVQVQVEIRSVKTSAPSDSQGRFQFDAATLFPVGELRDAGGLMLKLSKAGYQPVNKLVRFAPGRPLAPVTVQLDPVSGSAALAPAEKETLNKYAGAPGSAPLFLIPYSLTGIQVPDPKSVNEMLRANLERVIVTHLQASAVGGPAAVSLKMLPVEQVSDLDRMRTYGTYLNALGVITGYGSVNSATGGAGTLEVESKFVVVPQADTILAPVLYVNDNVPADRVASPRLYQNLSKLWGRSTVIALGVSEFRKAMNARDKEALTRIGKYLRAELANAGGPGDEALISLLNTLIEAVDRELAK